MELYCHLPNLASSIKLTLKSVFLAESLISLGTKGSGENMHEKMNNCDSIDNKLLTVVYCLLEGAGWL